MVISRHRQDVALRNFTLPFRWTLQWYRNNKKGRGTEKEEELFGEEFPVTFDVNICTHSMVERAPSSPAERPRCGCPSLVFWKPEDSDLFWDVRRSHPTQLLFWGQVPKQERPGPVALQKKMVALLEIGMSGFGGLGLENKSP